MHYTYIGTYQSLRWVNICLFTNSKNQGKVNSRDTTEYEYVPIKIQERCTIVRVHLNIFRLWELGWQIILFSTSEI